MRSHRVLASLLFALVLPAAGCKLPDVAKKDMLRDARVGCERGDGAACFHAGALSAESEGGTTRAAKLYGPLRQAEAERLEKLSGGDRDLHRAQAAVLRGETLKQEQKELLGEHQKKADQTSKQYRTERAAEERRLRAEEQASEEKRTDDRREAQKRAQAEHQEALKRPENVLKELPTYDQLFNNSSKWDARDGTLRDRIRLAARRLCAVSGTEVLSGLLRQNQELSAEAIYCIGDGLDLSRSYRADLVHAKLNSPSIEGRRDAALLMAFFGTRADAQKLWNMADTDEDEANREIAMLAAMNDGMRSKRVGQPDMEGEIGMGRRQRRVVIAAPGIDMVAAGRLDGDDDVVETVRRQVEGAVAEKGIGFGWTPAVLDRITRRFG